ncbi:MAG: hypothetical protein FJ216_00840 [Ignavibacteria bacterium]|nr:hypothetical protein [Ignavibacteria bacterium]
MNPNSNINKHFNNNGNQKTDTLKIAVFGDIHGCFHTLSELYDKVLKTVDKNSIYSVGDLIDRGEYSKNVLQFCVDNGIKPVMGNHEHITTCVIENPEGKYLDYNNRNLDVFVSNGGRKTQYSFVNSSSIFGFYKFREEFIDSDFFKFIKSLPFKYEFEKVIITHGGITHNSEEIDWIWNRNMPDKMDKLQIHGHTPCKGEIDYIENHYINIDTGCVYGYKLSCAVVDKKNGQIIEILQENLRKEDNTKV